MKQRLTDDMIVKIRAEFGYSLTKLVKLRDVLEPEEGFFLYSVDCVFGHMHVFLYRAHSPFAESVIGHWYLEELLEDSSPIIQASQAWERAEYLELT